MTQDVSVGIGGDNGPLLAALAEAKGALSEFFETVTAESAGVGAALEDVRSKFSAAFQFTGIAIATEALSQFGELIESLGHRAVEMLSISEVLGVTTDQVQAMQHAAEDAGVGIDALTHAAEKLTNLLTEARAGSAAAAEKLFALGVTAKEVNDPLFTINELLEGLRERLNDTSTAQETMSQLLVVLGSRMGLTAEAIKKYDGSLQGVNESAAKTNALTQEQVKQGAQLGITYDEVRTKAQNAWEKSVLFLTNMGLFIQAHNELAQAAGELVGADPVKTNSKDPSANLTAALQQSVQQQTAIAQESAAEQEQIQHKMLEQEMENVKAGVDAFKQGSLQRLQALQEYANLSQQYYGTDQYDKVKAALAAVTVAQREYAQAEQQQFEATTRALEREGNARWSLLTQEEQINTAYLAGEQHKADQLRAIEESSSQFANRMRQERVKGDQQLNAIDAKNRSDFEKQWGGVFGSMSSGFSNAINGMLEGTETFANGLRSLFSSVIESIIEMFVKMGVDYLETQVENALITKTTSAQQITANAGVAGSAAVASAASIPVYGWLIAAAAGAAVFEAASQFSAAGGFDIPAGVNPVTQLHQREMVLPANISDTIRDMAAGRGGGSSTGLHVIPVSGTHDLIRRSDLADAIRSLGMQFKLKMR